MSARLRSYVWDVPTRLFHWSTVGLMCSLVGAGLFAVDIDGIESGPLSRLVDFDLGRTAASIHGVTFNILLAVIAVHLLAIIFYLVVRRRNLTAAMITGYQNNITGEAVRGRWRTLAAALAASSLLAWWVAGGARL